MSNEDRILSILESVQSNMEQVNVRLDGIDARLDGMDARLDTMQADITEIKEDAAVTRGATNTLVKWVDGAAKNLQLEFPARS